MVSLFTFLVNKHFCIHSDVILCSCIDTHIPNRPSESRNDTANLEECEQPMIMKQVSLNDLQVKYHKLTPTNT